MTSHAVTFEMDYVEKRSRLTAFFRLILAIPHFIVLTLYSIAAGIVVIIAWFALLFSGRYPQGMYDFVAGFLRYSTHFYGYTFLATDVYPPFSGSPGAEYPVRLIVGPPKPQYSRVKVLFRIILAIPPLLITYAMQVVAQVGAILAWFAIVFLGRQPKGLQDMIQLGLSYQQRAYAYVLLLTEDWPSFTDEVPAIGPGRFAPLPATQGARDPAPTAGPHPERPVSPPPDAEGAPRPGEPGAPHTAPGGQPPPPNPADRRDD
jgi:Domain of unknown function (DUF4389)